MNALLTVIVFWLSTEFGLPAIYQHPRVEFVPPAKIGSLHDRGFASRRLEAAQSQSGQRMTVSVYDDAAKTIYLPEGWTGGTPAELSILIHEMVHHLQNLGERKFACPQEREQLAYEAQERWLHLFGGSLLHDFEIDQLTLLVTTRCAY